MRISQFESSPRVIDAFDRELNDITASDPENRMNILRVDIRVTGDDLMSVVRRTLGRGLAQCADIIGQFRCDTLVIGGRPSSLPAIRKLLVESLPVSPGQMVFLHEQDFGDWYPFTHGGRIGDAKTCGVVGACLAFQSQFQLGDFYLRVTQRQKQFRQRLGILNPQQMALEPDFALFEDDGVISKEVVFAGSRLLVGASQVNDEYAEAKPTYVITRHPRIEERLERHPIVNDELRFQLRLEGPNSDQLSIQRVRGRINWVDENGRKRVAENSNKSIRCRLQTMLQSDYWLDSGAFGNLHIVDDTMAWEDSHD